MKNLSQMHLFKYIQSVYLRARILGFTKTIRKIFLELWILFYYRAIYHSLSQHGEDIIMYKYLAKKRKGYYIDVGANDPWMLSNTGFFYKRGWNGITVEPNAALWKDLKKQRPNDININGLIEKRKRLVAFYTVNPHTLSTSSPDVMKDYIKQGYKLVSVNKIQSYTLKNIFSMVPKHKKVDILSIDTEGNELTVLKSNNWFLYRPRVICIETVKYDINNKHEKYNLMIEEYLYGKKYKKIADTGINSIFCSKII